MCVLCAYTGKKNAAQILWNMGISIEGLWSGFYTGLATMDAGRIYSAKCHGWSKYWKESFKLDDLPGFTGLFHSRTRSGGGSAWAHPFVAAGGKVALVSQGNDGVFSDMTPFSEEGTRLQKAGKKFLTSDYTVNVKRYPVLGDGARVHISEVMVNSVEARYEQCGDPLQAVREATVALREEGVSVFIFPDYPGRVYFANTNQRLVVAFTPDGTFAASSALAFGLPLIQYQEIPVNSAGYFTADELHAEILPECPFPFHNYIPDGCLSEAIRYLKDHESATLAEMLDNGFKKLFPTSGIRLRSLAAQRIGEILCAEGIAERKDREVEGVEGRTGLQTRFYWKTTH